MTTSLKLALMMVLASLSQLSLAGPVNTVSIWPPRIDFQQRRSIEHLQLFEVDSQGVATADLTHDALWRVEPEGLAQIGFGAIVSPLKDGSGRVIARLKNGREISVALTVQNASVMKPWSFENQVQAVITRTGCNQGSCHGSAAGKNGFRLSLRGYASEIDYDALTRQAGGRRLVAGYPEKSLILWKSTGVIPHGGGVRIAPGTRDYSVISEWVAEGAKGLSEKAPKVIRLEVSPKQARFMAGQSGNVTVRAIYSDKSSEDVTSWAKFGTTSDTVLKVEEDGRFKAESAGEAFVTVWYASQVAVMPVAVPSSLKVPPELFASAAKTNRNKIDELNLSKLQILGIPPSPDAGDAAWLRRITLDTTGLLPTATEIQQFMIDSTPGKRQKAIDRLISSDAAIDYWAYQWSDLFLVSSNKLTAPAMWAFYQFVRDSVAQNKPWDQFSREILTARGGTLENGAGNYFVLHRDPTELMETTSVAFLGLSMACAKCHNHPMEKWTQDQYYGFTSLLSRVGLKDGNLAGDVIVSDRIDGDIMHPRKGRPMKPQPLDSASIGADDSRSRREALADWMTDPENPLFARAIVNRVWKKIFGRGLIDPEDDLRATNPASDTALLAWLEADFKAHKFDIRHLLSTLLQSSVYARSSNPVPGNAHDIIYQSHYVPKRLNAEILLDVYSQVTDVPTDFAGFPDKWRAMQLPDTKVANGFLSAFGRPERITTCSCERSNEPSVAQALHLANGSTLNNKLKSENGLVKRFSENLKDDKSLIRQIFLNTLSRQPGDKELSILLNQLQESSITAKSDVEKIALRRAALEDLFWAVLTSDEFLFNH
ncbi:MAG: DUF1549 and DUF1553 domain-containing protein [Planctomycetota bacterium]|nr:DUF1549 and DUF1553 domain-containing protein [Planctomycetota bacterium]